MDQATVQTVEMSAFRDAAIREYAANLNERYGDEAAGARQFGRVMRF